MQKIAKMPGLCNHKDSSHSTTPLTDARTPIQQNVATPSLTPCVDRSRISKMMASAPAAVNNFFKSSEN